MGSSTDPSRRGRSWGGTISLRRGRQPAAGDPAAGGENFGDRYTYDTANRLVDVQYGVKDLSDPHSAFEQEVRYDLSPVGTWLHKTTFGPDGRIVNS